MSKSSSRQLFGSPPRAVVVYNSGLHHNIHADGASGNAYAAHVAAVGDALPSGATKRYQ